MKNKEIPMKKDHLKGCTSCGQAIKKDQDNYKKRCMECGEKVCKDCQVQCCGCKEQICVKCLFSVGKSCPNHPDQWEKFMCDVCDENDIKQRMGTPKQNQCENCNIYYCDICWKHMGTASDYCGEYQICKSCFEKYSNKCKGCNKYDLQLEQIDCGNCRSYHICICRKCICCNCQKRLCKEHQVFCYECKRILCRSCAIKRNCPNGSCPQNKIYCGGCIAPYNQNGWCHACKKFLCKCCSVACSCLFCVFGSTKFFCQDCKEFSLYKCQTFLDCSYNGMSLECFHQLVSETCKICKCNHGCGFYNDTCVRCQRKQLLKKEFPKLSFASKKIKKSKSKFRQYPKLSFSIRQKKSIKKQRK